MLEKLNKEDRKSFVLFSFCYAPIGLILGFVALYFLAKLLKYKIDNGSIIAAVLPPIAFGVYTISSYYKKLSSKNNQGNR